MNWGEIGFQIAIVIALVNWVKALSKDRLGYYAMLVSMGWAFVIVFVASLPNLILWYELVRNAIVVGLSASGLYTVAGKIGNK